MADKYFSLFQNSSDNPKDMFKHLVIVAVCLCYSGVVQSQRCNIEDRVKLALRTMNSNTVPRVVDCVIGQVSYNLF